jgi:hypothetical protein
MKQTYIMELKSWNLTNGTCIEAGGEVMCCLIRSKNGLDQNSSPETRSRLPFSIRRNLKEGRNMDNEVLNLNHSG